MPPKSSPPSHGEFVTLKEHLESRIAGVEKSIEVANTAMQGRLSGMNEFRETLKDQASRFITRSELEGKLYAIEQQIKELQLSRAALDGKASQQTANITLAIAVLGLLMSALGLILK